MEATPPEASHSGQIPELFRSDMSGHSGTLTKEVWTRDQIYLLVPTRATGRVPPGLERSMLPSTLQSMKGPPRGRLKFTDKLPPSPPQSRSSR